MENIAGKTESFPARWFGDTLKSFWMFIGQQISNLIVSLSPEVKVKNRGYKWNKDDLAEPYVFSFSMGIGVRIPMKPYTSWTFEKYTNCNINFSRRR